MRNCFDDFYIDTLSLLQKAGVQSKRLTGNSAVAEVGPWPSLQTFSRHVARLVQVNTDLFEYITNSLAVGIHFGPRGVTKFDPFGKRCDQMSPPFPRRPVVRFSRRTPSRRW